MDNRKKILIVEDEDDTRWLIKASLESAGYNVTDASNGQEALKIALTKPLDLIISDVIMPVMDGFKLNKELKKNKKTADIPFLVQTARGKMEDSFRAIGVDDFIAKPFGPQDLIAKVSALLDRPPIQPKSIKKILVAGILTSTVDDIILQLNAAGCKTAAALNSQDVITKVVQFKPDIILINSLSTDDALPPYQLIETLRKMSQSAHKLILVYSFMETKNTDVILLSFKSDQAELHKSLCMEAGANAYIGKLNKRSFLQTMEKYLF